MSRPVASEIDALSMNKGETTILDYGFRLNIRNLIEGSTESPVKYTLFYYLADFFTIEKMYGMSTTRRQAKLVYEVTVPVHTKWVQDSLIKRGQDYANFVRVLSKLPNHTKSSTYGQFSNDVNSIVLGVDDLEKLEELDLTIAEKFFAIESGLLFTDASESIIVHSFKLFNNRLNILIDDDSFNEIELDDVFETIFHCSDPYSYSPRAMLGSLTNFPMIFSSEAIVSNHVMRSLNCGELLNRILCFTDGIELLEKFYAYRVFNSLLKFSHSLQFDDENDNIIAILIDDVFGSGFTINNVNLSIDFFMGNNLKKFSIMMDSIMHWSHPIMDNSGKSKKKKNKQYKFFNIWMKVQYEVLHDVYLAHFFPSINSIARDYDLFNSVRDFGLTNSLIMLVDGDLMEDFVGSYVIKSRELYDFLHNTTDSFDKFPNLSQETLDYFSGSVTKFKYSNLAARVFETEFVSGYYSRVLGSKLESGLESDTGVKVSTFGIKEIRGMVSGFTSTVKYFYGSSYRGNPCMEIVFYLLKDFDVREQVQFFGQLCEKTLSGYNNFFSRKMVDDSELLGELFISSLVEISGNSSMPLEWASQLSDSLGLIDSMEGKSVTEEQLDLLRSRLLAKF